MPDRIRTQPCAACPYRKDVASGVWSAEEYAKLPPYDEPTANQPIALFRCHATPEFDCHGWAVVHNNRGPAFELLALRFWPAKVPKAAVPLFASGAEAAVHGIRDILNPGRAARRTMAMLLARYDRLRAPVLDDEE